MATRHVGCMFLERLLERISELKSFWFGITIFNLLCGMAIIFTNSYFWPLSVYPMFAVGSVPREKVFVPKVAIRRLDGTLEWVPKKKRLSHLPVDYRHVEALYRGDYKYLDHLLELIVVKNPEYRDSTRYKSVVLVVKSIRGSKMMREIKINAE